MTHPPQSQAASGGGIHRVFQGDAAAASRKAALFLLVLGPIPTLMLFGQKAVWIFLFGCVPAGLFLAGFYLLLKRIDRLELDDSTGMIVPYVGRPVSYAAVRSFLFTTDGAITRVSCRTGAFRQRPLLHAAGPEQAGRLRGALSERCPQAAISDKPRSAAKAAGLVAVMLVALHAGFLYYCREKWPVVKVACEGFEWPAGALVEPVRDYEVDGISYFIPVRFEPAVENSAAETRRYRDHAAGEEIRVHPARLTEWLAASSRPSGGGGGLLRPSGTAYLGLLGIRSTYDLMRWPYCDRIGAVPLILKASLIAPGKQPWELKLYETERGERSALIQLESSPGDNSAQILASAESGKEEILFTITGKAAIDRTLIAGLLRGFGFPRE